MTLKDADKIKEAIMDSDDFVGCSDDIKRVIDSVPEVAISTDTDTISRQAAIKALDKRFDSIPMEQTTAILLLRRDLRELPPANTSENPNSSDTISRAKAIEALNKLSESTYEVNYGVVDCDDAINAIAALPPTEPKKGKWIKSGRWGRVYKCNQCGNLLDFDGVNAGRGSTNFCPNCGADMRGEQDG